MKHSLFSHTILIIVSILIFTNSQVLLAAEHAEPEATKITTHETKAIDIAGYAFVHIPGGSFMMGSPNGKSASDERPQHQVKLKSYYLGKYEVTNALYKDFVKATKHRVPDNSTHDKYDIWQEGDFPDSFSDHPVINVSWRDAQAFCKWFSGKAGRKIRLPTEAEWEYAATGGDGRAYPWGNKYNWKYLNAWTQNADWHELETPRTKPVGSFSKDKSPFGVMDMGGNVMEWCEDWYNEDYYAKSPVNDPVSTEALKSGIKEGGYWYDARVTRGNSWHSDATKTTNRTRSRAFPRSRSYEIGFRLAMDE